MKPIYENHSLPMLLGLILFFFLSQNLLAQPVGSANLDQVRNGKASDSPPVPVWVNGNAGEQNSHYVEGYSIPYRVVLDGVPAGTEITLTLEFDAKHSGRHAIDYLTHYMRLEPHDIFGHVSEIIDPTDGVAGESGAADQTFPIPPPVGDNSPILGMPATSFNALPAAERLMSIWNGTITNIAYNESPASDLDTLVDKSAQQIFVTFTWGAAGSVILSWGGHIGSRLDWGFDSDGVPNSAGGVSGSPYHMRLIDWESPTVTLTNLGNQDRSLSAAAVITAPDCGIEGVDTVCENSTNTYAALSTDGTAYAWTLADNNTGAMIEGPNSNQTVDVSSGTGPGTFRLVLAVTKTVNDVDLTTTCDTIINVLAGPDAGEDGTATACNSIGAGSTIADLPAALGGVPNGGGSWSDDEATGVDLSDPTMVNFNGVAPGTYDFSYVVLGTPPCDNDTAVVAVTVEICCDLVVVCPDQPADLTCNETMPACVNDVTGFEALGGSVSGACGPVTVECNDNGVVCDGQVVRTLTISDGISSMECVLTYNFTKPIFAVSCSNANEAGCQTQAAIETAFTTWLGSVSSSGACGQAPISTDPAQPAAPDACGGTVQVTFTATDVCGRTATCTASFTVADAPPLSIICPGDPGLAPCTSQNDVDAAFANWLGSASPSGGCGPYTVTTNPTSPAAPDACGGSVEVTFTATDQCGQSATCTANFTVQDASFAMAICPASQSIGMGETQAYIDGQFATWIGTFGTNGEGCNIGVVYKVDGIEVPNLGGTTAPDAFGGQVDVEVIALSSCGNDTCSSSFTVEDTPGELFFTLPAQLTCFNSNIAPADSDLPAAFTQQEVIDRFIVISGPVDPNDITVVSQLMAPTIVDNEYTWEREYTASAPNVTPVMASEFITLVWNANAPTLLGVPPDVTLSCGDALPPWPVVEALDEEDGTLSVNRNQSERGASCGMIYERTWSAVDECQRVTTAKQLIRFVDDENPALSVAPDTTLECSELVPPPTYETSDACSSVHVDVSEDRTDHNACEYTLVRTYTATDACGNQSTATQTINVVDNVAPEIVLTNPALANVENGGQIEMFGCFTPQLAAADVAVSDCCGTSLLAFDELVASNVCSVFGYYRKWECGYIVEDEAGNKSEFTFTMVQYDTSAPKITGVPPDLEVVCNGVVSPPDPGVRADDNCAVQTEVAVRESLLFDPSDSSKQAIVRTWSAMDNCGNRAEASQTISVCGFDVAMASSGLGNTVWVDENQNGLQDVGEPGLNEVSVNLYWINPNIENNKVKIDSAITSTMEGQAGQFLFHHLMPGQYQMEFMLPPNMHFTSFKTGDDDAIDSDVDENSSMTSIIEVDAEQMLVDFDAGLVQTVAPSYELIGFGGSSFECLNTLRWSTVFETSVEAFEIQRLATDGEFRVIGNVTPTGGSGEPASYEVEDAEPGFESTYRLAIHLTDGTTEYSEEITLDLECEDEVDQELQTYPNPVRDKVTIGFLIDRVTPITLKLVDNLGRVVREEHRVLRKGRYLDQVDLSDLPDGVYWINMIFHQEVQTRMIVKSR